MMFFYRSFLYSTYINCFKDITVKNMPHIVPYTTPIWHGNRVTWSNDIIKQNFVSWVIEQQTKLNNNDNDKYNIILFALTC